MSTFSKEDWPQSAQISLEIATIITGVVFYLSKLAYWTARRFVPHSDLKLRIPFSNSRSTPIHDLYFKWDVGKWYVINVINLFIKWKITSYSTSKHCPKLPNLWNLKATFYLLKFYHCTIFLLFCFSQLSIDNVSNSSVTLLM